MPLFAGLLPSELDRIALVMHPLEVSAGHELCAEGEPGHEFFVIVDGEAVVERAGGTVAKLGPGDYFGELASIAVPAPPPCERSRTRTCMCSTSRASPPC